MSKFKFVMVILSLSVLFSIESSGANSKKLQIELAYETNLNVKRLQRIEIENGKVFFNALAVNPLALPLMHNHMSKLMNVSKQKKAYCSAGSYQFKVVKTNRTDVEIGCLNSIRFGDLNKEFSSLENLAVSHSK